MHIPHDDGPLREDLALLGRLFAEVLQDLALQQLFAQVEALMAAVAQPLPDALLAVPTHRGASIAAVAERLATCPQPLRADVLRAFAQMFTHINVAERVHRLRRREASLVAHATPQEGSLMAVAEHARGQNISAQTALAAAMALRLEPIFTAHPTEATRRSLLRKEQRMAALLLNAPPADAPDKRLAWQDALKAEMAAAWQTETLTDAPTVADEVEHVTFYLTEVIYPVVPAFYDGLHQAMQRAFGEAAAQELAASCEKQGPYVRFGTWVGGDMDGNPNVGPDTLRGTLLSQRQALMQAYGKDLAALYDRLSQSSSRTEVSDALVARIKHYQERAPHVTVPGRHTLMPYRQLLQHMMARLQPMGGPEAAEPYSTQDALLTDLALIAQSLDAHSGSYGGAFAVRRLMRRVSTFGLHLASLDVRQDSLVHKNAVAVLLGDASCAHADTPAATRAACYSAALEDAMAGAAPWPKNIAELHTDASTPLGRMLAVFRAIVRARAEFGSASIGLYIISMAQDVDDLLAVLLLAHAAGLTEQDADGALRVPLHVAPLFETVPDLERAPEVLGALGQHALWRTHLQAMGGVQNIMLGYSDSNKESGFTASRTALLHAEQSLVTVARDAHITLRLFHGRGGTASRGGSKPRNAILASSDPASHLRLTEQGEIIHAKYGLQPQVLRTLELMGGALWQRQMNPEIFGAAAHQGSKRHHEMLSVCSRESRRAYRALTQETEGFFDYFNLATPIDVITRLRIGSRPPSRRECKGLTDLRAIPWVFAWMQNRQMLPGWYGLGHGLSAAIAQFGLQPLADMYRAWPFFKNLIDDAAVGLATCDMAIGARYAALAGAGHAPLWRTIKQSYDETVGHVRAMCGQATLLQHEPVLLRGIARRNPLIDPMSLMQLDALAAWRQGGRTDDGLLRLLMLSVKGIAKGLHNTG